MLVGTGNVALFYGAPYDPRGIVASAALLGVLVVAGTGMAAWLRNPYHTVALVWALHGIVVANLVRQPQPLLAAIAGAGIAAVIGGYLWGRQPSAPSPA